MGSLREIAVPFVAGAPAGVRVRTRLRVSPGDAAVLRAAGSHLGMLAGRDLAARCAEGRLGPGPDRVVMVPDLAAALRRVEEHCLPMETARTRKVHGWPSAISRLLILNAEPYPGRGTVLLLREAIGF